MKRRKLENENQVDINLLTNEKQELPLNLSEETLIKSASVLAKMLLDFVRTNNSYNNLTPQNIFKKEKKE